jgi:hypothetical protein
MEDRRKQVEEELTEALGSEGKIRILRRLAENPTAIFTKYALVKATGLRDQDARRILEKLCQIDWVKLITNGVVKYQINTENQMVKQLIDFLKAVEAI